MALSKTVTLYIVGVNPNHYSYDPFDPDTQVRISTHNLARYDHYQGEIYPIREIEIEVSLDESDFDPSAHVQSLIDGFEQKRDKAREEYLAACKEIDEQIANLRSLTHSPSSQEYIPNEDTENSGGDADS